MANVFIIESDATFAAELDAKFRERGHTTKLLDDGNEAVTLAAQAAPDVFVLCAELPKLNGFSVCNRLKREPKLEAVPVVLISANASAETFEQHRRLPKKSAQAYVHKPVAAAELVSNVERLLGVAPPPPPEPKSERVPMRSPIESGVVLEARGRATSDPDLDDLLEVSFEDIPVDDELLAHLAGPPEPPPVEAAPVAPPAAPTSGEALAPARGVADSESVQRLEAQVGELERALKEARATADDLHSQVAAAEGQVVHFEREASRLTTELGAALERGSDAGGEAAALRETIATLEARVKDADAALERMGAEHGSLGEQLTRARAESAAALERVSALESAAAEERARFEAALGEAQANHARATEALAEMQASHAAALGEAHAAHTRALTGAQAGHSEALAAAQASHAEALSAEVARREQLLSEAEASRRALADECALARSDAEARRAEVEQLSAMLLQESSAAAEAQANAVRAAAEAHAAALSEAEARATRLETERAAASAEVTRLFEQVSSMGQSHEAKVSVLEGELAALRAELDAEKAGTLALRERIRSTLSRVADELAGPGDPQGG